jgi:lipopolysaccharide-induced tumor necrosis factor-alpha factor
MDPKAPYPTQPNLYPSQPGFNVPPPPDYMQSTQPIYNNPNNPVIVQPINPAFFSDSPMSLTCPNCRANVLTRVDFKNGALPWLICGGLCLLGVWCGCQFIPFCVDSCKDVEHFCPNCNRLIGVNRKL